MELRRDVTALYKAHDKMYGYTAKINQKIQSVCDFEIHLEYVSGDGWCFGSEISGSPLYMLMTDVIDVVEKTGKFTEDDWEPFG